MVNTKGGKNYKKGKKGKGKLGAKKTVTPWADSAGLMYAQVKKKLGSNRLEVDCNDGRPRQAIIPGSFYKRVWMNVGDIILVQLNELDNEETFILYKYDPDECHQLKAKENLRFDFSKMIEETCEFEFGDDTDEEDEEDVHKEVEQELDKQKRKEKEKEDNLKKQREREKKILDTDTGEVNIDDI